MFPGAITVTVRTVTTTRDKYGDTTETTIDTPWQGVMVAPRYANESTDPRVAPVIVGRALYGPATVSLDSDDLVLIDGEAWQVDGLPGAWPWPGGGMAGLEVNVKRAQGV